MPGMTGALVAQLKGRRMRLGTAIILLACTISGTIGAATFLPPKHRVATAVLPKVVQAPIVEASACASQTWPNLSVDCLTGTDRDQKVRVVAQ